MQIIYYTIMVLTGFTIGLSLVALSKEQKKNWIPYAFILGNAFVILVVFWMSNCFSQGMNSWARILLIILLLAAITIIVRERKTVHDYLKNIKRKDVLCVIVSYIAGLLPLSIYILWKAQFPYCDGYTYICISDYLMEHGYNVGIDVQEIIHHPWLSQMHLYQTRHFRIGAQMLLAFASSIFGVKFSLELFLPVCGLSIMLCGMATWMFVSNISGSDNNIELYSIVIFCFNIPIVQWCIMYGFLPQILGSAFCLAVLSLIFTAKNWKKNAYMEILQAAVVTAVFALTYNEMLPFFVIVIVGFFIGEIIIKKKESIDVIKNICIIGAISICMILTYVPGMVSAIVSQLGAIVGWNQNKDIITYMAQIFSVIPPEYNLHEKQVGAPVLAAEIITVVVTIMLYNGYRKSDKNIKYYYGLCTVPYIMIFIYFVFFTENPFIGGTTNTWSVFKLVQYYAVLLLPFIAIFFVQSLKKYPKIILSSIMVFVIFNVYQGINYTKQLAGDMKMYVGTETPLQEYYNLYYEYGNCQQTVELINVPIKHRQMITYFLKDTELVSDWSTDDYFSIIPLGEEEAQICLYYDNADINATAGLVQK